MSLGLDIRTIGRSAPPLVTREVREIVPEDLAMLQTERGIAPLPIKRISERHHALARALASGTPSGEAAIVVGLTPSRVSILLSDPSFKELIEFYRTKVEAQYIGMHEALAGLSKDAVMELQRRIEEEPDEVTTNMLVEITKLGADRTGFGPKSTQDVNVNVGLSARLQEARERVNARKMLDITPVEAAE